MGGSGREGKDKSKKKNVGGGLGDIGCKVEAGIE